MCEYVIVIVIYKYVCDHEYIYFLKRMCVCNCIHIFVHLYVCVYADFYAYMCKRVYIHIFVHMHTHMVLYTRKETSIHTCTYIYIHLFFVDAEICVGVLQNVSSYICTCACNYTCTCMCTHANKNHVYQEKCINVYVFNVM